MAPRLPDRYRTQVRLGRDGDVEEWLATDAALDRPVLVRVLSSNADPDRVAEFVAACRAAARVTHPHLAAVFEVGADEGTTFAVTEWNGGVSVADRLRAGEPLPVDEFLPNAAGLASGLAELHRRNITHGAVDTSAIAFMATQPAKLGRFGRRPPSPPSHTDDTRRLAAALRMAITGTEDPAVLPSAVVMGVPASLDGILAAAEAGRLDAAGLAAALRSLPHEPSPAGARGWSWAWTVPAVVIVAVMVLVGVAGLTIDVDPDSPFLFPATPKAAEAVAEETAVPDATEPPTTARDGLAYEAGIFDPFGEGLENDDELPFIADDRPATSWHTERYLRPLPEVKPGVGIAFRVDGMPEVLRVVGTDGARFTIMWSPSTGDPSFTDFVPVGSATLTAPGSELQLPAREGGTWLLWLTDLPPAGEDVYLAEIGTVEFAA